VPRVISDRNIEQAKAEAKFFQHEAAKSVRLRSGANSAAVRYKFIARASEQEESPPLARLLRGSGGRGGAARLKLYLSMLWMARNDNAPYFQHPAHQWARLLGFEDPDHSGARRIQDALRWLDGEAFVELKRRAGAPSEVRLLSDNGSGRPYEAPGMAIKSVSRAQREEHLYVQLSAGLWINGWVMELSGAAVAMLLVILHEQRGAENKTVWLSPRVARERYDLSDETRRRGLVGLQSAGLVDVSKRPLHQGLFEDAYRKRNVYALDPKALDDQPPDSPFEPPHPLAQPGKLS
jgi:hypothetical protein